MSSLVQEQDGTGFFGAAFASKELEGKVSDKLSVQIGDPYTKKRLIEATLEILKSKNILASQDLGAAGLFKFYIRDGIQRQSGCGY